MDDRDFKTIQDRPDTPAKDGPDVISPFPSAEPAGESGVLSQTIALMKSLQRMDGYWWFALEANETIGSEFIFLMHYLGDVDKDIQAGICRRIMDVQRQDGTWSLYHDGPPDLSTTLECYFALKINGVSIEDPRMARAREYILSAGGAEKCRVFTKIHLAMFGLVPWEACPAMPAEFIYLPSWSPVSIYSFSSWARATIVPLLVFMSVRKTARLPDGIGIDELFCNPPENRNYSFKSEKGLLSPEFFFIQIDRLLKIFERIGSKPLRQRAINKCLNWIWDHVSRTEDIYPAMAYGALAYRAVGYGMERKEVRKVVKGLKMFQQRYATSDVPALPDEIRDNGVARPSDLREAGIDPRVESPSHELRVARHEIAIHQQCCISPVWDTPWMITALLDAGVPADDPSLLRAGRWLIMKQITGCEGDWAMRARDARPGGWAFEFENDYFPDVDDTIQVLSCLCRLAIPWEEKSRAIGLGTDWLLAMQNDDGGWGAFDRNQTCELVNRIPFSDHGACLDPSSPDIAGRAVEHLASRGYSIGHPAMRRAMAYISRTQERQGSWLARWGVNHIYGTWCVLTGLSAAGAAPDDPRVARAAEWLISVQRADGGFSEAPNTHMKGAPFEMYGESIPSQTAWALMGLVAAGRASGREARRAAEWLLSRRNADGGWDERHYTGVGFHGHFYIRYHGYRHYFPLLALARYLNAVGGH
jgi:squalene-hopene/tetraprenyl-beta-curcumene cyclase